jgi:hypothetical protein
MSRGIRGEERRAINGVRGMAENEVWRPRAVETNVEDAWRRLGRSATHESRPVRAAACSSRRSVLPNARIGESA